MADTDQSSDDVDYYNEPENVEETSEVLSNHFFCFYENFLILETRHTSYSIPRPIK